MCLGGRTLSNSMTKYTLSANGVLTIRVECICSSLTFYDHKPSNRVVIPFLA